jgi:laccase
MLNPCVPDDVFRVKVTHGKTYYLRVINAALEIAVFFAVANHSLTVVELDASYVKPFTVNTIMLTPGQTADVLLHANQSSGQFYMAASAYSVVQYDLQQYPRIAGTGILQYELADDRGPTPNILAMVPTLPNLPGYNDSAYSDSFLAKIKSYNNSMYKVDQVPLVIDQEFFFTVGYALEPNNSCPPLKLCKGYLHQRFSAAVNNISFQNPTNISLLEAFYFNKSISESFKGFPDTPVHKFNYTGPEDQLGNKAPVHSTKVSVLNFNDQVQLVLQDISILNFTIHPFHLHGHNFYVVGWGYGNYDSLLDPPYFNLEDPPLRNTAGVPSGGWLAIRFRANNPGKSTNPSTLNSDCFPQSQSTLGQQASTQKSRSIHTLHGSLTYASSLHMQPNLALKTSKEFLCIHWRLKSNYHCYL